MKNYELIVLITLIVLGLERNLHILVTRCPQIYNNTPTHTSPANLKYRTFAFNNFSLIVVDIWQ